MVNKQRLVDAIKARGLRLDFIAEKLEISRQSLSDKINNKKQFKLGEIQALVKVLNLTPEEVDEIFFIYNVH
jgi:transcriptional regulator with XRE-family HTH domain